MSHRGSKRARGGGGIFKTAALAVLREEGRLMTTSEITRSVFPVQRTAVWPSIFKTTVLAVLREEGRLMTTSEITRSAFGLATSLHTANATCSLPSALHAPA